MLPPPAPESCRAWIAADPPHNVGKSHGQHNARIRRVRDLGSPRCLPSAAWPSPPTSRSVYSSPAPPTSGACPRSRPHTPRPCGCSAGTARNLRATTRTGGLAPNLGELHRLAERGAVDPRPHLDRILRHLRPRTSWSCQARPTGDPSDSPHPSCPKPDKGDRVRRWATCSPKGRTAGRESPAYGTGTTLRPGEATFGYAANRDDAARATASRSRSVAPGAGGSSRHERLWSAPRPDLARRTRRIPPQGDRQPASPPRVAIALPAALVSPRRCCAGRAGRRRPDSAAFRHDTDRPHVACEPGGTPASDATGRAGPPTSSSHAE